MTDTRELNRGVQDGIRLFNTLGAAATTVANGDNNWRIGQNQILTRENNSTVGYINSGVRVEQAHGRAHGGRHDGPTDRNGRPVRGNDNGGDGQDIEARLGQDFIDAVRAANQGTPQAREAALEIARQFTQNGRTAIPPGAYDVGTNDPLTVGRFSTFASPEEAVAATSRYLASQGHGTALTAAPATVPVGTGAPGATTPGATTPGATTPGATTPGATTPGNGAFSLPAAGGEAAHIYTRNGAGRTMNAAEAPKMSASQVEAIQRELGVTPDGKWGPDTQAAFVRAAQAAGVNPRDVDFTNPADPETVRVMAHFNAPAAAAGAQPLTAGGPAQGGPAQDAPAPDAARIAAAVTTLTNLESSDAGRAIDAAELAAVTAQDKLLIGRVFDLNNNGRVEEAELTRITAAAAAQPTGVTVAQGVNISSLFAGTSFGATTEVATGTGNTVAAGAALVATGAGVEQAAGQPQQAGQPQTGNANLTQNDVRVQGGLPDVRVATNVRGPVF